MASRELWIAVFALLVAVVALILVILVIVGTIGPGKHKNKNGFVTTDDFNTFKTQTDTNFSTVRGMVKEGSFEFTTNAGYTAPVSGTAHYVKLQDTAPVDGAVDRLAFLRFEGLTGTTAAVAPPFIGMPAGTLPEELRPDSDHSQHEVEVVINGVPQVDLGVVLFFPDGSIQIFRTIGGTAWPASTANTGIANVFHTSLFAEGPPL